MSGNGPLTALLAEEEALFRRTHTASWRAFQQASRSLLEGVPMPWMTQWASPYPLFVAEAAGASFVDIDGNRYTDFCYGDTGAMAGHSPPAVVAAVKDQLSRGVTTMLPTPEATLVADELQRRFGMSAWQFALTATDANRFAIRLARRISGRDKILIFNWSYHGSVDEALAILADGEVCSRPESIGPPIPPHLTTAVVEWNDTDALEAALESGEIACVLTEPVLTNIGIVHPDPGFHDALRELTTSTGTLLVVDETHTICCGPGGYTRAHGLKPDMITIGKAIAGGIPAAAYGLSSRTLARMGDPGFLRTSDVGGIGGTLAGNALSIAAVRATLEHVLTEGGFARMIALADRFSAGVARLIERHRLPWHISQLGCRTEYWFCPTPPRNGGEAAAAANPQLDRYLHLFMLNRGLLMTPFHNMALMSPATTSADVDRHTSLFAEAVDLLIDAGAVEPAAVRSRRSQHV